MRKEKTKKKVTGLDDERANLKKKLNIEKHETIGGLDLPEGIELKEEVIENSQKITTKQQWYRREPTNYRRRRADQQTSAAAAPTNCRRRRGAAGARLYL